MKFLIVGLCLVGFVAASVLPRQGLDDVHKTPIEIIEEYGYTAETHTVQTDDGYLLTLHRIPYGKNCGPENNRGPVLVQHGLLCSSADWVVMGPEQGLGFILADRCYDVWMGNSRGNHYSRGHNDPSIDGDTYWNFSWHEMGDKDLPAIIDYVLHVANAEDLFYIGHSQGSTEFWVFNELHPEYASKIKAMFAMAPISYLGHSDSFALQFISQFQAEISWVADWLGLNEFLPTDGLISTIAETVCKDVNPVLEGVCSNILFLGCGFDADELNTTALPVIFGHTPAGTSTKQLLHYAQLLNSGKFRWYDHGVIKNEIIYGSIHPPNYNLDKVTIPVYLYYSDNDWLANLKDVDKLKNELGNLAGFYEVPFLKWNHLDYLWGIDVVEYVYTPLINTMDQIVTGKQ